MREKPAVMPKVGTGAEKLLRKCSSTKSLTVSKLSKQQRAILEYLADDEVKFFERNLKEICYALLRKKTGRKPSESEAGWRLPVFLAELGKAPGEEVYFGDIYDEERYSNLACRCAGVKAVVVREDLLAKANRLRASVSRSLRQLFGRGLIVKTKNIEVYGSLVGNARPDLSHKSYYFVSNNQCQRLLSEEEMLTAKGQIMGVSRDA